MIEGAAEFIYLRRMNTVPVANVTVRRGDLLSAVAGKLIGALNAELTARYPEEGATHFRLDPEEVAAGRGAFMIAYLEGEPIGCGAIRCIEPGVGEIKRMYVARAARGLSAGHLLLAALEAEAQALGVKRLVLETGTRQHEAVALYRRAGFTIIPAFGEYAGSPLSLCMAKYL